MTATMSVVGPRLKCGIVMAKVATHKDYGVITNVKLQRISFLVWHLGFDVEVKKI